MNRPRRVIAFLCLLATIAAFAGAYLSHHESGRDSRAAADQATAGSIPAKQGSSAEHKTTPGPGNHEQRYQTGEVDEAPRYRAGELLVQFKDGLSLIEQKETLERAGATGSRRVTGTGGDDNVQLLTLGPGVSVQDALEGILFDPNVKSAGLNRMMDTAYTPASPDFANQWPLDNNTTTTGSESGADIHACDAWEIEKGDSNPVTVAVIDTGTDIDHPNLRDRLWTNPGETPNNGADDDGNGYVDDYYGYNWAGISHYGGYWGYNFGYDTDSQEVAQSFVAQADPGAASVAITGMEVRLLKRGSPASGVTVSLRGALEGPDLASFTLAPGEIMRDETQGNWLPTWDYPSGTFSPPASLTPGGTYYMVIRSQGTGDADNCYYTAYDRNTYPIDQYREGCIWHREGGAWTNIDNELGTDKFDMYFKTNGYNCVHDTNGHGTHCSGIVGAADTGSGSVGVAFGSKVKLMTLKVGDSSGTLWTSDWLAALDYARANGADIVSMSFGDSWANPIEQEAIDNSWGAGTALFAASGNDGGNYFEYPACYDHVISVAATDRKDGRASFSNFNEQVDISAPGADYYSTMPGYAVYLNSAGYDQGYDFLSGTSMATPCAAGVGALVLSQNPAMTGDQLEARLEETADDVGGNGYDVCFGNGRVNACRALGGAERKPRLNWISPTESSGGGTVKLHGSDFGSAKGTSQVLFDTIEMETTSWRCNEIECAVPGDLIPGSYPVTVVTPAGASGQKTYTVTIAVQSVDPAYAYADPDGEQILDVNIVGQNTHFRGGASRATFETDGAPTDGITVNSTSVRDSNFATASITVSAKTFTRSKVNVITGGEVPATACYFEVRQPTIESFQPATLYLGETVDVTVTGAHTHFKQGITTLDAGSALTVNTIDVQDPTHLSANITVSDDPGLAYAGSCGVSVVTEEEETEAVAWPVCFSGGITLSPSEAYPGKTLDVLIEGQGTVFLDGVSEAKFDSTDIVLNSTDVTDTTHVTANITVSPDASGQEVGVCVETGDSKTGDAEFAVKSPSLASVYPRVVDLGQTVDLQIVGNNTNFEPGDTTVFVERGSGGVRVNSTTVVDETHVTANITVAWNAAPGDSTVRIIRGGRVQCSGSFSVQSCLISDITMYSTGSPPRYIPGLVGRGEEVNIYVTGVGTDFQQGVSLAVFEPPELVVNSVAVSGQGSAVVNATVSGDAAPGSKSINVITGDNIPTPLRGWISVKQPSITGLDCGDSGKYGEWKAFAQQGQTVDVAIGGDGTYFVQGVTQATFSGDGITVNSTTVQDINNAVANITVSPHATLGVRTVNAVTGSEVPRNDSVEAQFRVGMGNIEDVAPSYACRGETLDVKLAAFGVSLYENGTKPVFSGSGITVNSVRRYSHTDGELSFIDANITVAPDAPLGARDVTVSLGKENLIPCSDFTVEQGGPPAVASVTPGSGVLSESNLQVTVSGTGFDSRFGTPRVFLRRACYADIEAHGVVASRTGITCYLDLTGATAGTRDVVVRNPDGTEGTLTGGFTITEETGDNPQPEPVAFSTWYLAEGSTAWGFSTYITIENPNRSEVSCRITYMTGGWSKEMPVVTLPPESQLTLNPEGDLGETDFSTKVECTNPGKSIAVDRTVTWTGGDGASGAGTGEEAHCSIGVNTPATTWYLPEGSSTWGFETWLLIQNPNGSEASCDITYMIEGEGPKTVSHKVAANSRDTFSMVKDIGNRDASIKVTSNLPVIPERAMYRNNRREGHDSIGTTAPATDYYLAEGAVGHNVGYVTYVLVQNPQESPTDVTVTYQTGAGQVAGPSFQMPANSRKTIRLNDQLPANTDVSTKVHGSQPITAERAMYWTSGTGEVCHDSVGMPEAHATFYLPDGQSSDRHETWTLVQNPNETDVQVNITYLTPDGFGNVTKNETIPAFSRRTFDMLSHSGIAGRAAIMVTCNSSGKKVMVERAMYWNSRGAGTDTIGGYSD